MPTLNVALPDGAAPSLTDEHASNVPGNADPADGRRDVGRRAAGAVYQIEAPSLILAGAIYRATGGKVPVVARLHNYSFFCTNIPRMDSSCWRHCSLAALRWAIALAGALLLGWAPRPSVSRVVTALIGRCPRPMCGIRSEIA